jgi:ubiquinol-cytochrome c reductase cytochrome b subunit
MKLADRVSTYLRERAPRGHVPGDELLAGGASFAYVFGKVLVFLFVVQALSGVALAAFYAPTTTDAWASVAYLQDQTTWGWVVRGVHHHGGGAIVVVAGLHLVQTAVAGAYKRPRELVWWLGLLLLVLTLAWAVTGYVLRWDQAGYWANRVELGIAASTPVLGGTIREVALGGNDYGNLTLTRFYALHVLILPAVVFGAVWLHIKLARAHGPTPLRNRAAVPRWPDQSVRDAIAIALMTAFLIGWVVSEHGADLAAPADPSRAYDARPLWYFRWLFELRELAGSAEAIVAMLAPLVVGGGLAMLPVLDRGASRAPRDRGRYLLVTAVLFVGVLVLTAMSFARDASDPELADRVAQDANLAARARALAVANGVPVTGAQDIWSTAPMWRARVLFAQKCAGCHVDAKTRKGPLIEPGHGNRAWLRGFLLQPSSTTYWGLTDLVLDAEKAQALEEKGEKAGPDGPQDVAMRPVTVQGAELDDLVEMLYAQSGATDVDAAKAARGMKVYETASCGDCHGIGEGVAGASAPGLAGLNSRAWYTSFISNPKAAVHMTAAMSQMPRFDAELSLVERDLIAEYLVWLRSHNVADLEALGPL